MLNEKRVRYIGVKSITCVYTLYKRVRDRDHFIYNLERKTVVVDICIYLYKFLENGKLLENMYEFITQFLQYKINPIFIFDGKPPESKIKVLNARQNKRQTAWISKNRMESDSIVFFRFQKKINRINT